MTLAGAGTGNTAALAAGGDKSIAVLELLQNLGMELVGQKLMI